MARRSRITRKEIEKWVKEHPAFQVLTDEERQRVMFLIERMAGPLARQGERAVFFFSRLDDAWISQMLTARADELLLGKLTKENLDMAQKLRDRERKSAAGLTELAEPAPRKAQTGGLASRYRALMKKTEGVEEVAIADTERRRAMRETASEISNGGALEDDAVDENRGE
ncbi:MAG: hypothetical protein SGI88_13015 [Candidatus Hydrogenedentes bacterium]|nr:hypothetical protein [Candidatus Hydrogenedentota bacterium]